ncbi:Holliday junction resolvase RuvX [Candidatus Daviesbacteria bacterium]|nr:Holliday junction resolvase RuvX [Candidatus Daviesbacteria bacterium]
MRYLGVDWGEKKIGLAISEGELASPLKVVQVAGLDDAVAKVVRVVKGEQIDWVVVGLPEGSSGTQATKFIKKLEAQTEVMVAVAEETLSSQDALRDMIEMGVGKGRRGQEDAYAAAIILQDFLDSQN